MERAAQTPIPGLPVRGPRPGLDQASLRAAHLEGSSGAPGNGPGGRPDRDGRWRDRDGRWRDRDGRWRPSRRVLAVGAAVLVVVIAVATYRMLTGSGDPPLSRADVDRAVQQGIQRAQQQERNAPPDAVTAYRAIVPSLVMISIQAAGAAGPAAASPLASPTAGPGSASPSPTAGSSAPSPSVVPVPIGADTNIGAGVVINASGAVVTALHVVEPDGKPAAGTIQVRFSDGTVATGTVTTRKPEGDIAVLAVDRLPQVVVPAVMGGGARVGDQVFPVGNPLTLEGTLTAGVVSGVNRAVRTASGGTLAGLLQFDAPVNPGSSGGPLLNRAGQVIGIVTQQANPSGQKYSVGIGFAVPIDTAGGAAGMPQK